MNTLCSDFDELIPIHNYPPVSVFKYFSVFLYVNVCFVFRFRRSLIIAHSPLSAFSRNLLSFAEEGSGTHS